MCFENKPFELDILRVRCKSENCQVCYRRLGVRGPSFRTNGIFFSTHCALECEPTILSSMVPAATNTKWSADFDTVRREKLFRNPPTDKTAYPALVEAVEPHIESFNAVFEKDGLLEQAIKDIGTKVFLDGYVNQDGERPRNRLSVRIREYFLDTSVLRWSNKFSTTNRQIYPAECRERHSTYRGAFRIRLEVRVNDGPWKEMVRDMGQLPIMLKVCLWLRRPNSNVRH